MQMQRQPTPINMQRWDMIGSDSQYVRHEKIPVFQEMAWSESKNSPKVVKMDMKNEDEIGEEKKTEVEVKKEINTEQNIRMNNYHDDHHDGHHDGRRDGHRDDHRDGDE